tara:strand:+ start:188 stop:424 length:237 start_codon:yes stop_codon:yes gene_type:complete
MSTISDHAGQAAISICEALLLALNDGGLLPEDEINGLLEDAALAHENANGPKVETDAHRAVAEIIRGIFTGGNSTRRL